MTNAEKGIVALIVFILSLFIWVIYTIIHFISKFW